MLCPRGMYMAAVIGVSFLVNWLMLAGTRSMTGCGVGVRTVAGALTAAVFAGLCMVPGFGFLRSGIWRLGCFLAVTAVSFGTDRMAWQQGGIFVILSMAVEGAASQIGRGESWVLLASAGVIWLVSRYTFRRKRIIQVEIMGLWGKVHLNALWDTGNCLRDPVTGEAVLVVSASAASSLMGLSRQELMHPMETVAAGKYAGLRLIPYRSVGTGEGMLLAKKFTKVKMDGAERSVLTAFAPNGLEEEGYQALAGGTCI